MDADKHKLPEHLARTTQSEIFAVKSAIGHRTELSDLSGFHLTGLSTW